MPERRLPLIDSQRRDFPTLNQFQLVKTNTKAAVFAFQKWQVARICQLALGLWCIFGLVAPGAHADDVIADNLTVNDDTYMSGNLWVNTFADVAEDIEAHEDVIVDETLRVGLVDFGFNNLQISTGGDAGNTSINFTGYGANTTWYWNSDANYGSFTTMLLDPNATLTLTGNSGNIVLDPNNGTISVNGTTFNSAGNITFFVGDYGFSVGNLAVATGMRSAAFGGAANATGLESIALADGVTSGNSSVAMAYGNATGDFSVALGNSTAAGVSSLAFGVQSLANATGSIALGANVTADAWSSVTVGHYNANITGNATDWAAGDPAFVVGIGENDTTRTNGLVVLNNGNITMGGNSTSTTINGNITISHPQGDIPMGQFGGE